MCICARILLKSNTKEINNIRKQKKYVLSLKEKNVKLPLKIVWVYMFDDNRQINQINFNYQRKKSRFSL